MNTTRYTVIITDNETSEVNMIKTNAIIAGITEGVDDGSRTILMTECSESELCNAIFAAMKALAYAQKGNNLAFEFAKCRFEEEGVDDE